MGATGRAAGALDFLSYHLDWLQRSCVLIAQVRTPGALTWVVGRGVPQDSGATKGSPGQWGTSVTMEASVGWPLSPCPGPLPRPHSPSLVPAIGVSCTLGLDGPTWPCWPSLCIRSQTVSLLQSSPWPPWLSLVPAHQPPSSLAPGGQCWACTFSKWPHAISLEGSDLPVFSLS